MLDHCVRWYAIYKPFRWKDLSILGYTTTIIPHYVVRRKGASTIYKSPFDGSKESIAKDIHNYIFVS